MIVVIEKSRGFVEEDLTKSLLSHRHLPSVRAGLRGERWFVTSFSMSESIRRILRTLLAGLLAVLPLVLTVTAVVWVGNFLLRFAGPDSMVGRVLAAIGLPAGENRIFAYFLGVVIVVCGLYIFGKWVESGMKERWQNLTDRLFRRVPLIGQIYGVTTKFVGLFGRSEKPELQGMSPVWVYFGGRGGTAALALMPTAETMVVGGVLCHVVLVPTAPVPFGGGLLWVPADWVERASFGAEGLTSIYVSMGVSAPDVLRGVKRRSEVPPHPEEGLPEES